MSLQEDYDTLRRLHNTTNLAVESLQERNRELLETNVLQLNLLANCQKALDITKENMRNALTMQNQIKDDYSAEIELLRAEIKRLKNGNHD
jgi:hypothetical protein